MHRKIKKLYPVFLLLSMVIIWFLWPMKLFNDPYCTVIYDKDGELLGAKIADDGQWRFPPNSSVPEKFKTSIIQFEDKHFYQHPGVNPLAFGRAILQNIKARKIISGGSTLTMQVIRLSRKGKKRTVFEKIIESILALKLEAHYSKEEVLAFYASHAPFGGNVVGLDAAAWRYFGIASEHLSWGESAALAVLPNAPSIIYPGKNSENYTNKRNRLLKKLWENQKIDELNYEFSTVEELPKKPKPLPQSAPHLLGRIYQQAQHKGKNIQTTLDQSLQNQLTNIISRHQEQLKHNKIYNAAAVVLDVESGDVLAYVGNSKSGSSHGEQVNIIHSVRSTGSILKPILFAATIDDGQILQGTLIPDIPTKISDYSPKNFHDKYDGAIPARQALARSLNIPAVRLLRDYNYERFHALLKKLGMTSINKSADHYGLSIILGGAESSLWEISSVYAGFARTLNHFYDNSGQYDPNDLRHANYFPVEAKKTNKENNHLISAGAIWLTFEALREVNRPETEEGWQMFGSSQKIAWKTGTSFGFKDAWAIGTSPKYVVGVWAGNADGEGRPGLTGIQAAAPILFDVFSILPHANEWFDIPYDELVEIPVCKHSGYRFSINCETADTIWVHQKGLRTKACPFHQIVHLDKTEKCRVHRDCEPLEDIIHKPWFVLPPIQEWYYKTSHISYETLPPFREDCTGHRIQNTMDFIYPRYTSKVYVPVELDGELGEVVFEIAHRKPETIVYWHLDDQYIGYTQHQHHLAMQPAKGEHILTLIDEEGEALTKKIVVLNER